MERKISPVLLAMFMLLNGCFLFEVDADGLKAKAKLKLIHRHSPELGENTGTSLGVPKDSKERIKQLVHSDHVRLQVISQTLGRNNMLVNVMTTKLNLVELPMRSGADLGKGQYFVSVRVGTPSKKYLLVVDTGSELTWIICKYKSSDCWKDRMLNNDRVFQPNQSSTYVPIPCSSEFCKVDLMPCCHTTRICPTPQTPCFYDKSYLDGTEATGYMGNDTFKIRFSDGKKVKLKNITFGCTESLKNEESFQHVDGVLGLGFEQQSFGLKASQTFGDKFSYCLVDHLSRANVVNFLVFGGIGGSTNQVPNMQHTELILGVLGPFYALNVTGISFNDKMLDIPSIVWRIDRPTQTGGMILDSGSTLTQLVKPAYDKVISALLPSISRFKKAPSEDLGLEHCFYKQGFNKSLIPRLAIHFANGAKFVPPVKSYVIDFSSTEKCLGFKSLPWPDVSIMGNILQQNHLWEFDLLNQKLSFAPSSCTFD